GTATAYAEVQVFARCPSASPGHTNRLHGCYILTFTHRDVRQVSIYALHVPVVDPYIVAEKAVMPGFADQTGHDAAHHLCPGGQVDAVMEIPFSGHRVPTPSEAGGYPVGFQWQVDGN